MTEDYRLQGKDFIPLYGLCRYGERCKKYLVHFHPDLDQNEISMRENVLSVYNAVLVVGSLSGLAALLLDSLPK